MMGVSPGSDPYIIRETGKGTFQEIVSGEHSPKVANSRLEETDFGTRSREVNRRDILDYLVDDIWDLHDESGRKGIHCTRSPTIPKTSALALEESE